jgi:hypothetical protein
MTFAKKGAEGQHLFIEQTLISVEKIKINIWLGAAHIEEKMDFRVLPSCNYIPSLFKDGLLKPQISFSVHIP